MSGNETLAQLEQMLEWPGLGATLGGFVRKLEIAEEEIERAGLKEDGEIFLSLSPPGLLAGKDLQLYRAHVAELCERRARGGGLKDLEGGTLAEALCLVMAIATKTPISSSWAHTAEWLFEEVMGRPAVDDGEPLGRESWLGEREEIIAKLRKEAGNKR